MGNSRQGLARATAERVLRVAGLEGPPVPIDPLVEAEGIPVVPRSIPGGSGFFDPSAWVIRLSETLFTETPVNRNRRRFTLAHELGHCLLEHGQPSCWNLPSVAEPVNLEELEDFPDFEQEAYLFAREVLLPREWFASDWGQDPRPERWEGVYGVSRSTLVIVLMERRLLMQRRKRR